MMTDDQNAADAAAEALRKISEFASSIDINIDKEKFINAGSGPEIFLDSAFDIAEMSYVIDKMDGIGCNEYVAPVFLHSGDTVIGRFPAFFSRSREDEQSYWQITGCALFEYKGTVWSFFIDAVPENGDSEITLSDIHVLTFCGVFIDDVDDAFVYGGKLCRGDGVLPRFVEQCLYKFACQFDFCILWHIGMFEV